MSTTTSRNPSPHSHDVARGPVEKRERALAPDLTRGALLLFIALANAANVAFAGQPGVDPTPHGFERVVNFFMLTLVDARAYPVFAIMFGYGLVQLHRRQQAAGGDPTSARRVLLRRNGWLVVFGLAHATFLYFGDFLGAYGIVGLACTWLLLPRSPRFHRVALVLWGVQTLSMTWLAVRLVLPAGHASGQAGLENSPNPSLAADSFARCDGPPAGRVAGPHRSRCCRSSIVVWLGIWAAQHRILEHPERHLRLLRAHGGRRPGSRVPRGSPLRPGRRRRPARGCRHRRPVRLPARHLRRVRRPRLRGALRPAGRPRLIASRAGTGRRLGGRRWASGPCRAT